MSKIQKRLSLLLNPIRRRIYEIVCESPGIHFYQLAAEVDVSQGTLTWHLRQLKNEELLCSTKFGGKRIFYPNMLSNIESAKAFSVLRGDVAQQVFRQIVNNPGINQRKIAEALEVHYETVRYHLNRFEKVGLIERYRDGRQLRGFPGKLGKRITNGSLRNGAEQYVSFLIKKLEEGCLKPITVSHNEDQVCLQVNCPGDVKFDLTIDLTGWIFHASPNQAVSA